MLKLKRTSANEISFEYLPRQKIQSPSATKRLKYFNSEYTCIIDPARHFQSLKPTVAVCVLNPVNFATRFAGESRSRIILFPHVKNQFRRHLYSARLARARDTSRWRVRSRFFMFFFFFQPLPVVANHFSTTSTFEISAATYTRGGLSGCTNWMRRVTGARDEQARDQNLAP